MWCEAYCYACVVDKEAAYLVQEAYMCGQIDPETAEQLWWAIAARCEAADRDS